MSILISKACGGLGAGQCVVDFGQYSELSDPVFINPVAMGNDFGGIHCQCTWWANARVFQLSGYTLGPLGDGACYAGALERKGFPVYKSASEALNATGTLAGFVISMGSPYDDDSCRGSYSQCGALGSSNHVAITEGYDPETETLYVSEMWGNVGNCVILLNSYSKSQYNTSCIWWADLSSVGFSASGGRKKYFKDTFGEFHWKNTPAKDVLIPNKTEYQTFCDRLNEAQDEAKVENKITFSASQDNGVLTAKRFNQYLYLMQESDDGKLLGVDEEECPWMDDVKKDDVIYAKHFLQLENLYNSWCYGSPVAGGGEVIINGGIARSCWTTLSAAYGEIPAAGIMGNIAQESSFDPTADNGSHYGLCQWGCYFAEIYYDRPGWEKQLDYILNGQTSSYRTTCLNPTYAGYGSAQNILGSNFSAFLNASTPERAAMIWVIHYENAGGQQEWERQNYARQAYNYYVLNIGGWKWID